MRLGGTARTIENNVVYLANLAALRRWYVDVRALFVGKRFPAELHAGLVQTLDRAIAERLKRLNQFFEIMEKRDLLERWPEFADTYRKRLEQAGDTAKRDSFLEVLAAKAREEGKRYLNVIRSLSKEEAAAGTAWLQGLVEETTDALKRIVS